VQFIDREEMKKSHSKYPHGGFVMTTGKTGDGNNAIIEYVNKWDSNPEATGSTMLACARAAVRLNNEGRSGAFTMFDIPPLYYSPLSRDELLTRFL
jgi:diaminopimelate dehydrogenase